MKNQTLRDWRVRLIGIALCGLASLAGAAPTVSLSSPVANTQYLAPATLTVSASASPSAGTTIARVDFYQGSTLIGTDTTTPYSITWSNAPAGAYSLTAKATDSAGGVTTSAARSITVNASNMLPTVSLSAPPANSSYLAPASVTLTASASGVETNTPISKIEFLDGSTVLATLTGSPYTYAWANIPVGPHSLSARATDSAGGVTTSAARTITVNASNTPTTVSLTAPANNASYTLPVTITMSASAGGVEVNTPISKVEFYQGTTRVGTATATPYSVLWTPPAAGSYSLTAKATDSAGGVTTSAARSVTIRAAAAAQVYYLHTDHLNTPRLVTDETNTVLWRAAPLAEPFGNTPPEEDPDGNGAPFSLNLRFPGQYADKETNLSYNYFRDYDPASGRYIESDPIGLQGGINTYGYVSAQPLRYVDPRGLAIWLCNRQVTIPPYIGNHAYFWNDKTSSCCGRNQGHDPLSSCKEKGPSGGDSCVKIEGSDGRESDVMSCCQKTANEGTWIPFKNDCHDSADRCLKGLGLGNQRAPGGRTGHCDSCWRDDKPREIQLYGP